jgi:signal transduction histidine kinase
MRVFEEFFSRPSGAGGAGTGLGLAISRAIVIAHNGKIWAEAAPGGGTTICFELPAAKASLIPDGEPVEARAHA